MSEIAADQHELYTATIVHDHGTESYLASTERSLFAALAGFCRSHWAQERQSHPALPESAPTDDQLAARTYFEHVAAEALELGAASLVSPACPAALTNEELIDACARVEHFTSVLGEERRALTLERARRLVARHAPDIAELQILPSRNPAKVSVVAVDSAREAVDLAAAMPAEHLEELTGLLIPIGLNSSTPTSIQIVPVGIRDDWGADPFEGATTREIVTKLKRELPRRQFTRRIRWRIADLQRVAELADAERAALARLAEEDGADHGQAIRALARIAKTAERLIAARRRPGSQRGGGGPEEAQVAFIAPVEVVVDLEDGRVTQVAVIDEAIELDPVDGVRERDAVTPVSATKARAAVAATERPEWPAATFGW